MSNFFFVFLGEMSVGKSIFINKFIGYDVLVRGVLLIIGWIYRFMNFEKMRVKVYYSGCLKFNEFFFNSVGELYKYFKNLENMDIEDNLVF